MIVVILPFETAKLLPLGDWKMGNRSGKIVTLPLYSVIR